MLLVDSIVAGRLGDFKVAGDSIVARHLEDFTVAATSQAMAAVSLLPEPQEADTDNYEHQIFPIYQAPVHRGEVIRKRHSI